MIPAEARRQLGMTVKQFAAALGVSPVTVRRWETLPDKPSHRKPGAATEAAIRLLLEAKSRNSPTGQEETAAKPLKTGQKS